MSDAGWLILVGLIEVIVAVLAKRAWSRDVSLRLGLVGGGVLALSLISWWSAFSNAYNHACD
jgi:hypothetical protein